LINFRKKLAKLMEFTLEIKKTPWKWGKLKSWLPHKESTKTFHVLGPWDMESCLGLLAKTKIFFCLSSKAAPISLWIALPCLALGPM
jgi:hypothetical protein